MHQNIVMHYLPCGFPTTFLIISITIFLFFVNNNISISIRRAASSVDGALSLFDIVSHVKK